jgi:alkanesulfonate monooxygenase SsuD/methylene tetrahydromethanopterin reductase-like flavin-dependent oxidoreductase (luciferase family)
MTRVNLGAWSFWMPALISAAEATKSLRVGTNVLNNDFRHPVLVAREAATIDLLTEGYAQIELNALVQRVVVTDHPRQAAEELARRWTQVKSRGDPPKPLCADLHGGQAD